MKDNTYKFCVAAMVFVFAITALFWTCDRGTDVEVEVVKTETETKVHVTKTGCLESIKNDSMNTATVITTDESLNR